MLGKRRFFAGSDAFLRFGDRLLLILLFQKPLFPDSLEWMNQSSFLFSRMFLELAQSQKSQEAIWLETIISKWPLGQLGYLRLIWTALA